MKHTSIVLLMLSSLAISSFEAAFSFGPNYYVTPSEKKEIQPWLAKIKTKLKESPKYSELIRKLDAQVLGFNLCVGNKGELLKVNKLGGPYVDDGAEKLGRELLTSISPLPPPPNKLPSTAGVALMISRGKDYPSLSCPPSGPERRARFH